MWLSFTLEVIPTPSECFKFQSPKRPKKGQKNFQTENFHKCLFSKITGKKFLFHFSTFQVKIRPKKIFKGREGMLLFSTVKVFPEWNHFSEPWNVFYSWSIYTSRETLQALASSGNKGPLEVQMAHSEKTFHGSEKWFHSGNTFTVEKSNISRTCQQ